MLCSRDRATDAEPMPVCFTTRMRGYSFIFFVGIFNDTSFPQQDLGMGSYNEP